MFMYSACGTVFNLFIDNNSPNMSKISEKRAAKETANSVREEASEVVNYKLFGEYIEFEQTEVGELIQKFYDNEINLLWGWIWDSGMGEFIIGRVNFFWPVSVSSYYYDAPEELKSFVAQIAIDWVLVEDCISLMAYCAACLRPTSPYTRWYLRKYDEKKKSGKHFRTLELPA